MVGKPEILKSKILVVDDEEMEVDLIKSILSDAGYESVDSTMTPQTVASLYAENNYDLILLDLQMPVMDGFGVMKKLREIETSGYLPVVVITGDLDKKILALQSGAKDFISNPLTRPNWSCACTTCWKCGCCTRNCNATTRPWSRKWSSAPPTSSKATWKPSWP